MDIPKILNEVISAENCSAQVARFTRRVVDMECNENTWKFTDKYDDLLDEVLKEVPA